jgi:ribonuclease PH
MLRGRITKTTYYAGFYTHSGRMSRFFRRIRVGQRRLMTGRRQIMFDCEVLQTEGETRTAAVTGSYATLASALHNLIAVGIVPPEGMLSPVRRSVWVS